MRDIYTSIDIGTDSVKIVVAERFNGVYNILASAIESASGVKKGLIVDGNMLSVSLKKAIKSIESKLNVKITKAIAIVPSNNMEIVSTSGNLIIKEEDNVINGNQIFSCMQRAMTKSLKTGMEVVSVFPNEFIIDKKIRTLSPLGKKGNNLSVKAIVTLVPKKNVYSVVSLIESLGIEVMDIALGSCSDYYVNKTPTLDKKEVAVINIGTEKTDISIFSDGIIKESCILPVGGKFIDTDIVNTYGVDINRAKTIKETFAVCNRKYADYDEVYRCKVYDNDVEISQYKLSELIEMRIIDLLKNAKIQLNNLTNDKIGYIIVTGGVTSMLGFNAIVEDVFVRGATVLNIGVVGVRDNRFSSCYGSIKYFCSKLDLRDKEYSMFSSDDIDALLSTRRKIGNNTIGKFFGKLFD